MNILHVGHYDKFLPKHIKLTNKHFNPDEHLFLMMDKEKKVERVKAENVKYIGHKKLFSQMTLFYKADKIILHGLFEKRLLHLLFLNPWLIKKCYWMIWGGDLYNYLANKDNRKKKNIEFFRRFVISRLPYFITYVRGDFELAQKWYGAKGEMLECLMYESNLYSSIGGRRESYPNQVNILLGNSASLSNNHLEALDLLKNQDDQRLRVFSPLSYGKESHRKKVIQKGKSLFGERFEPITKMMPFEEYVAFLNNIDIAVFNHKRQQAMGNIITLLGLGKKVFMSSKVSSYRLFSNLGIKVFDVEKVDINPSFPESLENQEKVKNYFCKEKLLEQWREIYSK